MTSLDLWDTLHSYLYRWPFIIPTTLDVGIGLALAQASLEWLMPSVILIFVASAALCDSNDGPNTSEDKCKSPTSGMKLSDHHNPRS